MLNKVVLPYTIWYTGLEKILRLNLDKGIDTVTNISTKATLNGTSVNDLVSAIFNPKTKSIDITIRSDARMDVDGEMEISLSYSDAKTHESILVVSVRSHENGATENPKEVKQTKLTLLNGRSHTVGAADEQVVYSFDLVDRNVTDEFATYGDVKDMLIGLGVTDSGEKDQYTILLEGDNLVLSKENDPSYRKVINLAKYHDEVSGEPLNVEDLKRDILSIVDGKLPNVETLKSDILSEAATKDAQLKVDILHEVDGKIPNGDTIKQEILADVNPRIPDVSVVKSEILNEVTPRLLDKETLKEEILSAVPTPANYTLTMEEDNLVLGKEGDASYRKVIDLAKYHDTNIDIYSFVHMLELSTDSNRKRFSSEIIYNSNLSAKVNDNKDIEIYNTTDYYENGEKVIIPYKILTISHDILSSQNVDVEQIKTDILAAITIPKTETIKEEILQALPTIPNYTLTLNENTLTLGKEGDSEYVKTIDLSKYVNGPAIDTEQLKQDIIAAIHIPDENAIKQNILSEVNPKLIDKDIFKNEVLAAIPSQSPVSPSKLVSEPSITNGVLKFNIETDAPTVDFTNEFYTKAKIDELLRSSSNSNIPNNNKLISGSGRPDATDHPNNNAPIGTIFIDVNTTNGASVWYRNIHKWEVIVGDTGWKRLNAINLFSESGIFIRRINNVVYIKFGGLEYDLFGHVALNNAISKKDTTYIRLVEVNNIPEGFRTDNAYVGTSISDYITPGKILGSYYVTPQSDSNYIKLFYNESVPNTDQKDLRLQPGTWPIGNAQPWPTL